MHVTLFDSTYEFDRRGNLEVVTGLAPIPDAWVKLQREPIVVEPLPAKATPPPQCCGDVGKLAVCTLYGCSASSKDGWVDCRIANHWGD